MHIPVFSAPVRLRWGEVGWRVKASLDYIARTFLKRFQNVVVGVAQWLA